MIAQTKAELLKMRSTRTMLGLMLGLIALVCLFSVLTGLLSHAGALSSTEDQRELLSFGSLAGIFSALAGVLLVTSEYRYGRSARHSCSHRSAHAYSQPSSPPVRSPACFSALLAGG